MNHNPNYRPPQLFNRLLEWFCSEEFVEVIQGDLHEFYVNRRKNGVRKFKADFFYLIGVLSVCRPFAVKRMKSLKPNFTIVFRHSLLISFRSFNRYKSSFLINLIGFSSGLACTLLIFLWVNDEMSVDKFHVNQDKLYQVMINYHYEDGVETEGNTPEPLAQALLDRFPEVERFTQVGFSPYYLEGVLANGRDNIRASGRYVGANFFDVFSYKLIYGDSTNILPNKKSVAISKKLANSLFGKSQDAIGQEISWNSSGMKSNFYVSGVFDDVPSNSTAQFEVLFHFNRLFESDPWAKGWNATPSETYLILKDGTNIAQFNKKISGIYQQYDGSEKSRLFVNKYADTYLFGNFENGVQSGGRIVYVRLFSLVGIIILILACINFTNLATAQASRRMKEFGIKKTVGAGRGLLIGQFLVESLLIAYMSLLLAALLCWIILPEFNQITGKVINLQLNLSMHLSIVGIVFCAGLLAGLYPAFYLSRLKPATIIKGKLTSSFSEIMIRRGLFTTQFVISIIFIGVFLIVHRQIQFVHSKDLGYNKTQVISFHANGSYPYNVETFMTELRRVAGVVNAGNSSGGNIIALRGAGSGFSWDGSADNKNIVYPRPHIGYGFFETLDIDLIAGRTFSEDFGNEQLNIVINEAAAKLIGRGDIIGKTIYDGDVEKQIIGVVENFHIKSLHEKIEPCFIRFYPKGRDIMVRLKRNEERATIKSIETLYQRFHPGYPFEFSYLDNDYSNLYKLESRVASLSKYFTVIAIIISCLGLFGLATFNAERKIKEIGIRKVLGASVMSIAKLITGEYTKLILLSMLIAIPLGYLIAKAWLDGFAYHIDLRWWYFVIPSVVGLVIAWLTIGFQTYKSATLNPVKCLLNE